MKVTNDLIQVEPARSLSEGWHYRPDWRLATIDRYLAAVAGVKGRDAAVDSIIYNEKDPFVRQGFLFRLERARVAHPAFAWAFGALFGGSTSRVSSILRAMVIADRSAEEIACELFTTRFAVITFEKLAWDVRRYLDSELWLGHITAPETESHGHGSEMTQERIFLRVAYEEGWPGLRSMLYGEDADEAGSLDAMTHKLEKMTGRRALRYVRGLEAQGAAPTEDDLRRHAMIRAVRNREGVASATEQESKTQAFYRGVIKVIARSAGPDKQPYLTGPGQPQLDPSQPDGPQLESPQPPTAAPEPRQAEGAPENPQPEAPLALSLPQPTPIRRRQRQF